MVGGRRQGPGSLDPHRPDLHFTWQEEGGPPVTPGEHRGFGSMMLEKIVPAALQGTASLDFDPQGLCWTLRVPVSCLDMGEDRA